MNWRRFLDRLIDDDEAPKLPPITSEEAVAFAAALEQRDVEPIEREVRREWQHRYGETWEEWLRRSASQHPRRERDDG